MPVSAIPGADSILFNNNLGTIAITSGILPIMTQDLIINGGSGNTVSGNNQYRVFFVESGNVALNNLAIANGLAQGGRRQWRRGNQ